MSGLFLNVFNMSITAGYFVLAIVLFRLIFKKTPKWVNCLLWALVGLRLAIPFNIESDFSLLPTSHTILTNKESSGLPFSIDSGIYTVDTNVNDYLKSHYFEGVTVPANTFTDTMFILSVIWLTGVAVMLLYGAISFIKLKKRVSVSLCYRDNIYYCDNIETPFVLGVVRPEIYIPSGLGEDQIENVIMHENAHLKRKDHWWKPLGFLILSFYWFNPLIWVAYILLCRDIEKACDEKVIKNMTADEKKGYLETLLECSVQRKMVLACPVAFGEVGVKQRVKAVLNYKKPAFWVVVIAIIVIVAVSVGFLTMPEEEPMSMAELVASVNKPRANATEKEKLKEKYPHFFDVDYSDGLTVYVTKLGGDNYKWYLSSNKNPTDPQKVLHFSEFADTEEMVKILYTYDVGGSSVEVVPIQHILSSFWWENPQEEADSLREALGFTAKEVWTSVDRLLLDNGIPYDEFEFFKEMTEYEATVIPKSGPYQYMVLFTESQYHKLMTDKYNQVSSIYNSFEENNDEYAVIKKVEFDENFRILKIYIDKELYEGTSFDQIPGVIRHAYCYQMFLCDGNIGVNVEVINYKTNKVYSSYIYPEDDIWLKN